MFSLFVNYLFPSTISYFPQHFFKIHIDLNIPISYSYMYVYHHRSQALQMGNLTLTLYLYIYILSILTCVLQRVQGAQCRHVLRLCFRTTGGYEEVSMKFIVFFPR